MNCNHQLFHISQKALLFRNNKILVLEINNRPKIWDLPGGMINRDEEKISAFKREIKEEIGLDKFEIIDTVDYDVWKTENGEFVCNFFLIIKNDNDEIKLSNEHSSFAWISENEIDNYHFVREEMKGIIKKGFYENSTINNLNSKFQNSNSK